MHNKNTVFNNLSRKIKGISARQRGLILVVCLFSVLGSYFLISSHADSITSVFISQNGGIVTGDGTACDNAGSTDSASFFNTSGNWGTGSSQIGPGTTVNLCGTITTSLKFNGSGSSGNPITLYFEPGASISVPVCPQVGTGCIDTNGQSYVTINGGTPVPNIPDGEDGCTNSSGCNELIPQGTDGCDNSSGCNGPIPNGANGCSSSFGCMQNGAIEATANGTDSNNNSLGNQNYNTMGIAAANCSNCTIENLSIGNLYQHNSPLDNDPTNPIYGGQLPEGIGLSGSNMTIDYNTIHDTDWAFVADWGSTDSNVNMNNNDIYNIDHGFAGGGGQSGGNIGPVYFTNNTVHDYSNWDTDLTPNCNNDETPCFHHDGLHCWGPATPPHYNGFYIYDNNFEGNVGDDMTAQIFIEGGVEGTPCADGSSNLWIFNNYITSTDGSVPSNDLLEASSGTDHIYNNTIVGAGPTAQDNNSGIYTGCTALNNNTTGEYYFENNIVSSCQNMITIKATSGETYASGSPDYDLYANGGENSFNYPNPPNHSLPEGHNCTDWAGTGYPFVDEDSPSYSGDGFYDYWQPCTMAGLGSEADAHGLAVASADVNSNGSLQLGSPAIEAGANLTSLCNNSGLPTSPVDVETACKDDINGIARPASGNWDIGAFQYSSDSGTPPTVNLTSPSSGATVSGTTTITATASATSPATVHDVQFQVDGSNIPNCDPTSPSSGSTYQCTTWNTTGLSNGSHTISAIVTDSNAQTDSNSESVTVSNAPAPTVNLSANPTTITSGNSSTLSWTSSNATSCAATTPSGWTNSSATSGSKSVSPTSTTTYTISCTGSGGSNQASTTITVNPSGSTPPSVPTGLTSVPSSTNPELTPTATTITLTWNTSSDSGGPGLGGYTIYRGGTQIAQVNASTTTYTDYNLSSNTSYSYTISAYDTNHVSSSQSSPVNLSTISIIGILDGGSIVQGHDLSILLANYNSNYVRAEFDGFNLVEGHDLSQLLGNYGQ
jgi:hypothetical protein